jgi:NADP-dependent 3-hydroxy acid dehydrogenase YdfG
MKGKVVIITGASSGIGEALARRFHAAGARLSLAARRIDRLVTLEKELGGPDILSVETDVSKEEDCRQLILKTVEKYGQIDVLINNAGISMRAGFGDVDPDVLRKLMDVNFWGTVYGTRFALPWLLKSKGSVVGIISIAGHIGMPGRTGYAASKFAVRGFLDTLRIEYLKKGLHVLVVAPGFTTSEIRFSALNGQGKPHGETSRNENQMMSAETCANYIFRAVKKRKRSLILTFKEGTLAVFLGKFWPSLLDKLTYYQMAQEMDSPLIRESVKGKA